MGMDANSRRIMWCKGSGERSGCCRIGHGYCHAGGHLRCHPWFKRVRASRSEAQNCVCSRAAITEAGPRSRLYAGLSMN